MGQAEAAKEQEQAASNKTRSSEKAAAAAQREKEAREAEAEEEPTQLVTNCRVLAEGVDLPAVDLVVFADAKHSHVDILQCMGARHVSCRASARGISSALAEAREELCSPTSHLRRL